MNDNTKTLNNETINNHVKSTRLKILQNVKKNINIKTYDGNMITKSK